MVNSIPVFPFPSRLFVLCSFQETLISSFLSALSPDCSHIRTFLTRASWQVAVDISDPCWMCLMWVKCVIHLPSLRSVLGEELCPSLMCVLSVWVGRGHKHEHHGQNLECVKALLVKDHGTKAAGAVGCVRSVDRIERPLEPLLQRQPVPHGPGGIWL